MTVAVRIHDGGSTPSAGMNYSLYCDIDGAGGVNLTALNVKYNWTKINDFGNQVLLEHYSRALKFSSLKLSDAGKYTCVVTLDSHFQHNMTNTSMESSFHIPIQSRCMNGFHAYKDHKNDIKFIFKWLQFQLQPG